MGWRVKNCGKGWVKGGGGDLEGSRPEFKFQTLEAMTSVPVTWLWPGLLQAQKCHKKYNS